MAYVICEPCVGIKDGACAAACPVQCIYDEPRPGFPDMLFIHPIECIDCGLCVTECPVEAILHEADVPDMWEGYIDLNRRYFDAR
jgi:ferredoxin